MIKKILTSLFLCVSLLYWAGVTNATILTFEDLGLSNQGDIPGAYGDNVVSTSNDVGSYSEGNGWTPNITVDYRAIHRYNSNSYYNNLDYWDTGYGDLTDVAYPPENNYFGEISFIPGPGWFVILNSFDLGGWKTGNRLGQTVQILDENFNILIDYSLYDFYAGDTYDFTPDIISSSTVRIKFGPSWGVAIDNINFDQKPIPEPATILLISSGLLGLLGIGIRRRKK